MNEKLEMSGEWRKNGQETLEHREERSWRGMELLEGRVLMSGDLAAAEVDVDESREVRHRLFAIVDRTRAI